MAKILESDKVKHVGIAIDNKLDIDSHVATISFKANQKLSVISTLTRLLTFHKKGFFLKHFSNFNVSIVFWLGWFLTEGPIIELINYMNECYLNLTLLDLLAKYGSFTVRYTSIQILLLEMYQIKQVIWKLLEVSP